MDISQEFLKIFFCIAAGYLIGGIPFAYIVARISKGIDIRKIGSGNPGATNVYRSVGKIHGVLALLLDTAKGALAVLLISKLLNADYSSAHYSVLAGLSAIAGHTYTPFLSFKGGKGVATGLGVFSALAPLAILVGIATFSVIYAITRYVSAGSIAAAITVPIAVYLFGYPIPVIAGAVISGFIIIIRHKSNIIRLIKNTETKTNL